MGLTDLDVIYRCNKWELDAILEGLHYQQINQRENLAELALSMRYTMNAKKIKASKLSKDKDRKAVKKAFAVKKQNNKQSNKDLAKNIARMNDYFMQRN